MPALVCIHLGLGDLINYAPLIKELSKDDHLIIPCFNKNLTNAGQMFDGLNIELMPIEDGNWDRVHAILAHYKFKGEKTIGIGYFSGKPFDISKHVEIGYEALGYNFKELCKEQFLYSQSLKVGQETISRNPYAFVPEGGSTGLFKIDRKHIGQGLDVAIPGQKVMLLTYRNVICEADEIHCHDTSWPWLINQLPTTGKLFFHKGVRDDGYDLRSMFTKEWTIIE